MMAQQLEEQVAFILELEKLKTVTRQNQTLDGRQENSAEHSWQLAIMAMTLIESFPEKIELEHVFKLLLLHDVGEIGAGDTSAFDEEGKSTSYQRELQSIKQTFSLLPAVQKDDYLRCWQEFEKGQTAEARYARCIDALAPLLNHLHIAAEGGNPDGLTKSQILSKKIFYPDRKPTIVGVGIGSGR